MARNKQIGPEIKLYQIDTMIYLTTKNIVSKIEMFSKFLEWGGVDQANSARINNARAVERFDKNYRISDIKDLNTIDGQANETWLRKSGFIVSTGSKYELSPIATAIIENKISIAEYCFLILSKQWVVIKKPGEPSEYKANLLALVLEILSNQGNIPVADFVTTINQDIVNKYIEEYDGLALSNQEASRFIIEPLILSGILDAVDNVYRLSVKHKELIDNYLLNYKKIKNPNELLCLEESYFNCFKYGVFDIIDADNKVVYSNIYPGLFKQKINNAIDDSLARQCIYYGCPGSGKSRMVKEITNTIDPNYVFRTTFHPDTDYSSFVGCYKPSMKDGNIEYSYSPQIFADAYVKAWEDTGKPVYLIIEEINRGNCAQIFGDLFQLLDRDKATGKSEYPIKADKDLVEHIEKVLGAGHEGTNNGELCLPPNLIIYATMNTSDQSLFPMDSAFKRRWDWEYAPINYSIDIDSGKFVIEIDDDTKYSWVVFLKSVNDKIYNATNSEDKQMGNFFIKKSIKANEFVNKVMFYLWDEVCKEEYGTQRNFFRKGKDGKTEFKFTELFSDNQTTILKEFMTSLGVEPIGKKP